jgi:WD40 repeat protein
MPIEEVTPAAAASATTLSAGPDGTFTATKSVTLATSPTPKWVLERVICGESAGAPLVDRVNAVRFSPDGKTLAVGGGEPSRSGDISLWDVATGKLVKNWPERHTDAVLSLEFSPNGKLLASGGADKLARITDVATGKSVQNFEGHTHHVMGVAFRADSRILASAGADGVVLVWDLIMGERKKKIEGWSKEVTSLQYVGATPQIVTSAGDNLVRIVNDDGTAVRAIDKLPDFMQAAASTPNGAIVIAGGEDSFLRIWDGTNGKEVATFGAK